MFGNRNLCNTYLYGLQGSDTPYKHANSGCHLHLSASVSNLQLKSQLVYKEIKDMGSRISQSSGHQESSGGGYYACPVLYKQNAWREGSCLDRKHPVSRGGSFFAVNLYHSFRQSIERRRRRRLRYGQQISQSKRSSMHRPVLRLQVKSETLEKHRKSGTGLHLISKEKLETLAKESGMYENIFPASPPPYARNHTHNHFRHSNASHDSMVIVQFVDDGPVNFAEGGRHENGYDKLLPKGDFDHLCTFRYEKVNSNISSGQCDSSDDHLTTLNIGQQVSQPSVVNDSSQMEQLRNRIIEHLEPYEPDHTFQRSTSMSALSSLRISDFSTERMRRHQSTGYLDADLGEWSLGESIMRTLSRGNVHLFDIDNPKYESEKEIHRAWPNLKQKMVKWRQSQNSLNDVDSDGGVFSDSGHHSIPPSGRLSTPPTVILPQKSSQGHLV